MANTSPYSGYSFTPDQMQQMSQYGFGTSMPMNVSGSPYVAQANWTQQGGEGGSGPYISGYSMYDPNNMGVGSPVGNFGMNGQYTGTSTMNPEGSWKDALVPAAAAAGMYFGMPYLMGGGGGVGGAAAGAGGWDMASAGAYDAGLGGAGSNLAGAAGGAGGSAGAGSLLSTLSGAAGTPLGKLATSGLLSLGAGLVGSRNGSAPTPPNPYDIANQQLQANIQAANYTAGLNRVNQTGPYGSLTYTRTPGQNGQPDTWTANYALDPAQQKLLDLQNARGASAGQQANNLLGSGVFNSPVSLQGHVGYGGIQDNIDTSHVPGLIGGDQLASDLTNTRNALYDQQAQYLDPQYANQLHDLQTQLQNQGINQTTAPDAYNRAMDEFNRQRTFAYQSAMNNAITGGGAEQSRLFNIGLASNQNAFNQALQQAAFHNAAQGQGFGQALQNANLGNSTALAQRNQTLNEIGQFGQMSAPTLPQFGNVPQASVGPVNIADLLQQNYANQMGGYNAKVASNNSLMNGIFGLGAAYLGGKF